MSQPYQQPERYCLMQYQCEKCGHLEHIWNSRNAVTPFCTACALPGCDGMKQHINWQADRRWTALPPQVSRVFISITRDDAERLAREKLARFESMGVDPVTPGSREKVLAEWAEHIHGDGNQPLAVTRAEYLHRQAAEGQPL